LFADSLNDGEQKSGGLAGAGFGTTYQILTVEDDRNRPGLYWGGFCIPERLAGAQLCGRKSQLRKIHKLLFVGDPNL
jgi:hypothetical protein